MTIRVRSVLLALLAALVGSVLLAAPAAAAERVVTITAEGVTPQRLEVRAGDTLTFVNEDRAFRYAPRSTGGPWDFEYETSLLNPALGPGERWTVRERGSDEPFVFAESGTYSYSVFEDAESAPQYQGTAVLPAASPAPASPATSPRPSPQAAPSSPSPAASPSSGTAAPPITGGLGTIETDPSPAAGGLAPPPAIALPDLPGETPGPAPDLAPELDDETVVTAVPGRLGSPPTARGYGLPAALAAVLAAGVASLLVRLLLAQPAARRRGGSALSGPAPVATVD